MCDLHGKSQEPNMLPVLEIEILPKKKRKKKLTSDQLLVFFIDVRCQFSDPDSAQTSDQR